VVDVRRPVGKLPGQLELLSNSKPWHMDAITQSCFVHDGNGRKQSPNSTYEDIMRELCTAYDTGGAITSKRIIVRVVEF